MEKDRIKQEYIRWLQLATDDIDIAEELKSMGENQERVEDAFYKELSFGTGGLRGVIGAGTNRINIYTVAKASQGLADYVVNKFVSNERKIAISYDSRIKSNLFAKVSAGIFAANGIQTFIYPQLMPTPCLSYAVRELKCVAGIMITASHNPSKYNGYKVYGADGCQITTEDANEILKEIEKIDVFTDINKTKYEDGVKNGMISYIPESVYTSFIEAVKAQTMLNERDVVDKNVAIVYTPLNGTGLKPVLRILKESGYDNVTVVKEQENPDGNFPTCPYPNPEIEAAMKLGMKCAKEQHADLLLATDPDCDRVGVAVKNSIGEYTLLSGNETGILLLDYICSRRIANGTMPENPIMVKTIVTMDLAERIAAHYGVKTKNVLTGFKYIGEQIGILEKERKQESYIFGFEESYGYLSGTYVRDKDAVDATFLICEMFAYYKTQGIGLLEKLEELYTTYGFCLNTLHSYEFDGAAGFAKMQNIMGRLRKLGNEGRTSQFGGKKLQNCLDYNIGLDGLPKANVLKFQLEDNCSFVVRPSGTEPKLKIYISVSAENMEEAKIEEEKVVKSLQKFYA